MAPIPCIPFYFARLLQVLLAPYQIFFVHSILQDRTYEATITHPGRPSCGDDKLELAILSVTLIASICTLTVPALDVFSARRSYRDERTSSASASTYYASTASYPAFEEIMIVLWLLSLIGGVIMSDTTSTMTMTMTAVSLGELLLFVISGELIEIERWRQFGALNRTPTLSREQRASRWLSGVDSVRDTKASLVKEDPEGEAL